VLTEKETRIVNRMVCGKLRRERIFSIIILIAAFLVISLSSLSIKNKLHSGLGKVFQQSNGILDKIRTTTKLEGDLKAMAIRSEKDIQGITLDLVDLRFNWQVIWFGAFVLLIIFSFWKLSMMEKIIIKLHKETEDNRR